MPPLGRNIRWIMAGTLVVTVAVSASLYFFSQRPEPTPVADFSAPFVFGRFSVPVGNPLTEEAFQLGRRLFYDPRLSGPNSISCASCHRQELAFTDGLARSTGVTRRTNEISAP